MKILQDERDAYKKWWEQSQVRLTGSLQAIRTALQRQSTVGCSCYADSQGDCAYCHEGMRIEAIMDEYLGTEREPED